MKVVEFAEDWLIHSDNFSLLVSKELLNNIINQNCPTIENGGCLYGYKIQKKDEYRITGYTTPMKMDEQKRCNFIRNDFMHMQVIQKIWSNDKVTMYLGDWHTHPFGNANPSSLDLKTFREVSVSCQTTANFIFFALITPSEIGFYALNKKGEILDELSMKHTSSN